MQRGISAVLIAVVFLGCERSAPRSVASISVRDAAIRADASNTVVAPERVVKLVAGEDFTCALRASGRVFCWGRSAGLLFEEQLHSATPTPQQSSDVADLVVGGFGVCARKRDETLVCWIGSRFEVQPSAESTRALRGVRSVALGDSFVCAVIADGSVVCAGNNEMGQLGDGTREARRTFVPVRGVSAAVAVTAGSQHACALLQNQTVQCWGREDTGLLGPIEQLPGDAGAQESFDYVAATGQGPQGAVDFVRRSTVRLRARVVPQLAGVAELSAADWGTCARTTAGEVLCWGENSNGVLGDGTTTAHAVPTRVQGLSDATSIAAGMGHVCAATTTGAVRCWGAGAFGRLGTGTEETRMVPTVVAGLDDVVRVAAGARHSCALQRSGDVWCWGEARQGALGNGVWDRRGVGPIEGEDSERNYTQISLADAHRCALRNDGLVSCWGQNVFGPRRRGANTSATFQQPGTMIPTLRGIAAVVVGAHHSCARTEQGSVWCWGENDNAQLGDGTHLERRSVVRVQRVENAVEIAAAGDHTCARTAVGTVLCWGSGFNGWIGSAEGFAVPVAGIDDAAQLATGIGHVCVQRRNGSVWCWGVNEFGQVGDGTMAFRAEPVRVRGLQDAEEIAAGNAHTCARRRSGAVVCWGSNETGALGDGVQFTRNVSAEVRGLPSVRRLAVGDAFSCAIVQDGSLWCWGAGATMEELFAVEGERRMPPTRAGNLDGLTGLFSGPSRICVGFVSGRLLCTGTVTTVPIAASLRAVRTLL